MNLEKIRRRLEEAKNIGAHAAAQNPWRHHAIVATVGAALRPGRHRALQDVGQRMVYPEFARLESRFRKDLTDVFNHLDTYTNRRVKQLFRVNYTQAFKLGHHAANGGVGRPPELKPEDKKWLESFLRKEFDLWKKFMEDVKAKRGKLDYDRRKEMYVQALRSMYNSSRAMAAPPTTLYYWETTIAEHCPHCLYLASKGPFTKENLPTVPASGDTKCLSNCKCHLRIHNVSAAEYLRVKRNAPSREEILRGMRALG
jgi:hypothetical protein